MKFFRVLCVLAIALCIGASVYAETQSVKVSGDLTMRAIVRDKYDYQGSPNESGTAASLSQIDSAGQNWFMSVAAIQVDADLTDNVQTVIRVLNQRDWNVTTRTGTAASNPTPNGTGWYTANADEFDIMLDLAYLKLKDFIYSPLTVTIGRQDLWFGKGFIVGANQQNPAGNLSAPEYTDINSFDAVKAVLDYDPWTISGIYSKIAEGPIQVDGDIDLWGINVGYKFNSYNAEAEGYWFYKTDKSIPHSNNIKSGNDVYTIGARGSVDPISWVTLAAEGAWQGGSYIGAAQQATTRARSAWALDVSGEVRYFTDKCPWKPKFGVEYIFYSGDKSEHDSNLGNGNVGGTYTGWDPMYRGKYDSAIREFVGKFYRTYRYPASTTNVISSADDSRTNQSQIIFLGSVQPIESVTVKANYNMFWNEYNFTSDPKSGTWIGSELDINATWDYTEDVSFGVLAGWFFPGEVYYDKRDSIATDLVGTVKVSF